MKQKLWIAALFLCFLVFGGVKLERHLNAPGGWPHLQITVGHPEPESLVLDDHNAEKDPFDGYPKLKTICSCESAGRPDQEPRQFKDGAVLTGRINPKDTGACQINLDSWGKTANTLGYDLYTEEGNVSMAKWIYDRSGSKPWTWSESCWNKKGAP